jgi:phosphate transport system protein
MSQSHILSAFDRDLEVIQTLVLKMGGLVEAAMLDSAEALERMDAELALKVRMGDLAIDALEQEINIECARVIALRAPAASDLRTVLTMMKIAANLERCGDYAKNLAKRAALLVQMPVLGGTAGSIRRMAKAVTVMLHDALDAYFTRDLARAEEVRQRDKEVDQMYSALFRELLTHMLEDPRDITAAMHLHFIAKNIERVGDHATGIAEQVIYLMTGQMPSEARPKADVTSGRRD